MGLVVEFQFGVIKVSFLNNYYVAISICTHPMDVQCVLLGVRNGQSL